ncbi:kinase-like domain-containing protein [Xylaria sp. FL0933]|nr:kinase-like domain-containing protein [Xylaria sp. FL0933]
MDEVGLIAWVYALPGLHFEKVQDAIQKNPQCKPPKPASPEPQSPHQSRNDRETTAPPMKFNPREYFTLDLRFSHRPKTPAGLIFGKDEACDIVLPDIPGISRRHFALTYKKTFADKCYRLVVRDLGSRNGTWVRYVDEPEAWRRSFDWILDGFDYPNSIKKFLVAPFPGFEFFFVVRHQALDLPTYINNVERFGHGTAGAEDLLGNTAIDRGPETVGQTPRQGPIILRVGPAGEGGNGIIYRCWNVSNGAEYACKQPKGFMYSKAEWEKERDFMLTISHDNIVRLCYDEWHEGPRLYMEYMPFRDLWYQDRKCRFSKHECMMILVQTSSALEYLHDQLDIAHRDLKPENVLVQYRDPRNRQRLIVKVTDFGLSKIGNHSTYTKKVDIWSLGAVILRLTAGFPTQITCGSNTEWCNRIVERVSGLPQEELFNVLRHMLVITPEARYSAKECFREAQMLLQTIKNLHGQATNIETLAPVQPQGTQHPGPPRPQPLIPPETRPPGRSGLQPQRPARQQQMREAPPDYSHIQFNGVRIAYMPSTRAINVTQLFKLYNVSNSKLSEYLRRHPQVQRWKHTPHDTALGTFVGLNDALQLCNRYNIDPQVVNWVLDNRL